MKKIIVLFLVVLLVLCGCASKKEESSFSNHHCINCGKAATHFAGKQSLNGVPTDLYYCDDCYQNWINENSDRIVDFSEGF